MKLIEHSKFSKISDTLLFPFSNKILVIRADIHKMLVRIANREDQCCQVLKMYKCEIFCVSSRQPSIARELARGFGGHDPQKILNV